MKGLVGYCCLLQHDRRLESDVVIILDGGGKNEASGCRGEVKRFSRKKPSWKKEEEESTCVHMFNLVCLLSEFSTDCYTQSPFSLLSIYECVNIFFAQSMLRSSCHGSRVITKNSFWGLQQPFSFLSSFSPPLFLGLMDDFFINI